MHSFFLSKPGVQVKVPSEPFWYKLSIPGGVSANFHLGPPWCSINRPKSVVFLKDCRIYRTPRPAEVKVRKSAAGDLQFNPKAASRAPHQGCGAAHKKGMEAWGWGRWAEIQGGLGLVPEGLGGPGAVGRMQPACTQCMHGRDLSKMLPPHLLRNGRGNCSHRFG